MNPITQSFKLFESGVKLFAKSFIYNLPFIALYGAILGCLLHVGLVPYPRSGVEWGLSALHYFVYLYFFTISIMISYLVDSDKIVSYKTLFRVTHRKYLKIALGYSLGLLWVFNPYYYITVINYLQKGLASLTEVFITFVLFFMALFNFLVPIECIKPQLIWQSMVSSWRKVTLSIVSIFSIAIFSFTFVIGAQWMLVEFVEYSTLIICAITLPLFPCLMVITYKKCRLEEI